MQSVHLCCHGVKQHTACIACEAVQLVLVVNGNQQLFVWVDACLDGLQRYGVDLQRLLV